MHPIPTFEKAALIVLDLRSSHWSDPREARTQLSVFQTYIFPHIGDRLVSDVTVEDVIGVLLPIWHVKPAQARRVLRQVRDVLRWACAEGFRRDDVDAAKIAFALGPIKRTVKQRPSIPHSEVASVIAAVHRLDGWIIIKIGFEFLVLTAARSSEVLGARWEEIDFERCVWTVPAERMKIRRSHSVPLSPRSVTLLLKAREVSGPQGLVFPSRKGNQLTSQAFSYMLRRLGVRAVPSGFRASFGSWCLETGVAPPVVARCLSHHTENDSFCIARSQLLDLRRPVMHRWSEYLAECARELPAARDAEGGAVALRVPVDGG